MKKVMLHTAGEIYREVKPTGRWKTVVVNGQASIHIEGTYRPSGSRDEITSWIHEDYLSITVREEFINECGNTNG